MVLIRPLLLIAALAGCSRAVPAKAPAVSLSGTDGASHAIWDGRGPTVLVFYANHCPCMKAHATRLADLVREFEPRGVRFFLVDSEAPATMARDTAEAHTRGYTVPILLDQGAKVAGALGAEYATYTVVLDRHGDVAYRGGIDSEVTHLTDHPDPYLRDALADVTAGRTVRRPDEPSLGCALQKW